MSVFKDDNNLIGNKLLAALPREDYERLLPTLELISLSSSQVLYEANKLIEYAYFPLNGVCSMLNIMQNGKAIEAATVGYEGMIGVPLLLGSNQIPMQAISQIPGDALRIKADTFQREVYWGCTLHSILLSYTQTLMNQILLTSTCNRIHSAQKRCCRWLLMTRDRVESNEFPLAPEFLCVMLGVRRSSRSEVVTTLRNAGLIRYERGIMTILDPQGLESASCKCYQVLKQEFNRLIGLAFSL